MEKWRVTWDYASSYGGPWAEGEILEMTEAEAKAINRDSPGVLSRHVPKPAKTRQVRAAKATRGKGGKREN